MFGWRLGIGLVLIVVLGLPLGLPILDALARGQAWEIWHDGGRLLSLALVTILLVAGTLALSLPAGVALAVLLFRTDVPLRRIVRFLTVLALFVPLPLVVSAWQATGTGGWLPWWQDRPGQPWAGGLLPAIWVHSLASLPWIILLVGQGLCWVEGELEEDALLVAGPWRVLWHVTLPRCRALIAAAALWVGLQTAAEISVTDMFEVRTFAEEIFTQLSMGGADTWSRAVAVSLPTVVLVWLAVVWLVPRLDRALPPLQAMAAPPRVFRLKRGRWPCALGLIGVAILVAGVPLASLVWKLGLQGWPPVWSASYAWDRFSTTMHLDGSKVALSIMLAVTSGMVVAGLALVSCWAAGGSRLCRFGLLSLMALAWALPGPVVGIGLKQMIDWFRFEPLATWLYYGPSPLPVGWAYVVRFFPCAVAVLWPAVRMIPRELREAAQLDGARPRQELARIVIPLTTPTLFWSALTVAALSLGEIAASKLAETPGSTTFTHLLFNQMHSGVDNDVAALCLVLLAGIFALVLTGAAGDWLWKKLKRPQGGTRLPSGKRIRPMQ